MARLVQTLAPGRLPARCMSGMSTAATPSWVLQGTLIVAGYCWPTSSVPAAEQHTTPAGKALQVYEF